MFFGKNFHKQNLKKENYKRMTTERKEELARKMIEEFFTTIDDLAEKCENEGIHFRGLLDVRLYDTENDMEMLDGQYKTNIDNMEELDFVYEAIKDEIANDQIDEAVECDDFDFDPELDVE